MSVRPLRAPWFAAVCLLAGCGAVDPSPAAPLPAGEVDGTPRDAFTTAGAVWDVPPDLLMAIAHTETGGQMVEGAEEIDGWAPAWGLMALRGDNLTRGAALAGLDVAVVQTDRAANVAAAAALLSAWADEAGVDRTDLGAWAPLVARYAGLPDDEATSTYVWEGVYGALQSGFVVEDGTVGGMDVRPDWPQVERPSSVVGAERAYAVWRPSANYNGRDPGAGGVGMVVIHACEGSYAGCWGWLVSGASGVSAHYVLNEAGTEVSQLVHEADRAWHVGATYDCTLNGSTECARSGWNVNHFAVGLEHAGYSSQTSWDTDLLDLSAQLTCDITRTHNIPRDSYHIVAHARLQPYNRTDPGSGWPWADYLDRVHAACGEPGSGATAGQIVIDSNNAANDLAAYRVDTSANWTSSANVSGYWNTGYWVAPTQAVSDPARFQFLASAPVCYRVDAWWTAAADRSAAAPWIGVDASGREVGRAVVDQSADGSQWNTLGTWGFYTGWNRVDLSRWAPAGFQVVADAVRLTPATGCVICGDGVRAGAELCDDGDRTSGDGCSATCAGELAVTSLRPVVAGRPLTVTVDGARPGARVQVFVGSGGGATTPVRGCASATLPFSPAQAVGQGTADPAGHVAVRVVSPPTVAGHVYKFVAVDAAACLTSPVWRQRF